MSKEEHQAKGKALTHSVEMDSIAIDQLLKENLLRATYESVSAKYGLRSVDSLALDILTKSPPKSGKSNDSLEILIPLIEETFGRHNSSLSNAIGKRLYSQLRLELQYRPQNSLRSYVANARLALLGREKTSLPRTP